MTSRTCTACRLVPLPDFNWALQCLWIDWRPFLDRSSRPRRREQNGKRSRQTRLEAASLSLCDFLLLYLHIAVSSYRIRSQFTEVSAPIVVLRSVRAPGKFRRGALTFVVGGSGIAPLSPRARSSASVGFSSSDCSSVCERLALGPIL